MKTVGNALLEFEVALTALYDKPEARSLAYMALEHFTQSSRTQLRAFPERELSVEQTESLKDILQQLQTGKPLQYVLGETEFYGLKFKVNPSVLIPRPETEELVAWVLDTVKGRQQPEQILDIGTGSGCIPITLKKHLPNADVSAIDISNEALTIAKENAKLNDVDVNFTQADIFDPKNIAIRNTPYSILISNPPYITEQEKAAMHTNVLAHEPHLALFVTNDDPLLFYRAIADFALLHLAPNGLLFFEINENYGKQTVELLTNKLFINIRLIIDLNNKDRMIKAEVPGLTSRHA